MTEFWLKINRKYTERRKGENQLQTLCNVESLPLQFVIFVYDVLIIMLVTILYLFQYLISRLFIETHQAHTLFNASYLVNLFHICVHGQDNVEFISYYKINILAISLLYYILYISYYTTWSQWFFTENIMNLEKTNHICFNNCF